MIMPRQGPCVLSEGPSPAARLNLVDVRRWCLAGDADRALLCVAFANLKGVNLLEMHGELPNRYLLTTVGLNVKRSSAVCAVLATPPRSRSRPSGRSCYGSAHEAKTNAAPPRSARPAPGRYPGR